MKRLIVIGLCVAMPFQLGCRQARSSDLVSGTGTWLVTGDCHAWHVKADSGRYDELRELSPEFRQSDLRIRFTLRERLDIASFCTVGAIADVVSMTRR